MHFPSCCFLCSLKLLVISPVQRQKTHLWCNQDTGVRVCMCARVHMRVSLHSLEEHLIEFSLFIRGLLLSAVATEFCFPPDSTKGIYVSCHVCCGLRLEHYWLNMNAYFSSLESRSSPTSISLLLYSFVSLFPGGIGKEISAREWFKCLKGQIVK